MSDWIEWHQQRPTEPGIYWWRTSPRKYGGLELRPEFTAKLRSVGMGYSKDELWPGFSHWDGFKRTVPGGTEWKPAEEGTPERTVVWPGLDIGPCPFCGRTPTLKFCQRAMGGGIFVGSYVFQANEFGIECPCRWVRSPSGGNLEWLITTWNRAVKKGLTESFHEFRDAVLHERHQLAEAGLDSDQTNAVLGLFDDIVGSALYPEDDEVECETCQGTRKVPYEQKHVTDGGTKWQRTSVEHLMIDCPDCEGK